MSDEPQSSERKRRWLSDQSMRIVVARRALIAAKKQRVSEYDERLRKLRDLEDCLVVKHTDEQQLEMFVEAEVLTQSLDRLLANPLHGLE